jgi:FtsZ-binding cell division protein ZapB
MSTIDTIIAALKDHFTAGVLREQIVILEKEIVTLMDRNKYLEKENADLVRKNEELQKEISALKRAEIEFVEYEGIKIKRLAGGGYSETPCCVHCLSPMFTTDDFFPYECSKCGYMSDINRPKLKKIIETLKA